MTPFATVLFTYLAILTASDARPFTVGSVGLLTGSAFVPDGQVVRLTNE